MKFFRVVFTKMKDYFTANLGRKIFFYGLVATILNFVFYVLSHLLFFYALVLFALLVTGVGTLWDSMLTRYEFLKKVREIQYNHLKDITDRQAAGENIVLTPTFTDEEKRYLRRRKWWFVLIILFKVGLVIALFSLLSSL